MNPLPPPNVYVSDRERTLLVERYNAINRAIARMPNGSVPLNQAFGYLLDLVSEQNRVIGTLVDIIGNTESRKG